MPSLSSGCFNLKFVQKCINVSIIKLSPMPVNATAGNFTQNSSFEMPWLLSASVCTVMLRAFIFMWAAANINQLVMYPYNPRRMKHILHACQALKYQASTALASVPAHVCTVSWNTVRIQLEKPSRQTIMITAKPVGYFRIKYDLLCKCRAVEGSLRIRMSSGPGIASGYDITQHIPSLRGTAPDSYSTANCSV